MTRSRRSAHACAAGVAMTAIAGGGALAMHTARAQSIDVQRGRTLVVGAPGGARAERGGAARTAFARSSLPSSGLRVEWRASAGSPVDDAPLVDARGATYVVGTRGEVVALARDGTELWRVLTGAIDPGPAVLLSDDTVVFVDTSGEAIAVHDGGVRWRSRFGRADPLRTAPIALDDGGVVAATARDLAVLDTQGRQRARVTLPEATTTPLLSALGQIIAVTASGAVWGWVPGTPEATRIASFGSPIVGSAALADAHTLLAVAAGQTTLVAVDLLRGASAPAIRAMAQGGLWLGPPALRGPIATLAMLGPTSELAITIDAEGRELGRCLLTGHVPAALRFDAGVAPPGSGGAPPAPLLVDEAGTLAFATMDGSVGVAPTGPGNNGSVELLSDACASGLSNSSMPVAGLAPLPPASMVIACRTGTVLALAGAANQSAEWQAAPRAPIVRGR
jgi:hypothetical protein